jgi:CheY-like chemotaxis protein
MEDAPSGHFCQQPRLWFEQGCPTTALRHRSPVDRHPDAPDRDLGCDAAGMRILLVDPQPDSRCAMARWLDEFFGHVQMESAASGAEEVKAVEKRIPDLVLPAHAGTGRHRARRDRQGAAQSSAVVVVTSSCAAGFDVQCKAAGVDLWLEKRHLQARLLDFLQKRFPKTERKAVTAREVSDF